MLHIKNLSVEIEEKKVLNDVTISFEKGKNYCLLGKNWSWKSSLALTIMWHPSYEIVNGEIFLDGESVLEMEPDQRAQSGIFLAFQSIPEIKWVKLFEFLRTIYAAKEKKQVSFVQFKRIIFPMMEELWIDTEFLWRDLNVWFSGWERRKVEVLQLRLLEPRYIFLDEVDSWLDVDALRSVSQLLKQTNTKENSFIIITHYFSILDYLSVDEVLILENGSIVKQWGVELANHVRENGFG